MEVFPNFFNAIGRADVTDSKAAENKDHRAGKRLLNKRLRGRSGVRNMAERVGGGEAFTLR